jgi:hypothetical protein
MSSPGSCLPDVARSRLRETVATIERELWHLSRQVTDDDRGMRAATRCGCGWTTPTPPTARDGLVG